MHCKLAENVHWVGVVDWGRREFHGHELSTHRGTTYNAYLIRDEKDVLIDTVYEPFTEEFLDSLEELIDPAELDYVVANHAEVDHSGALPAVLEAAPGATLITSSRGAETIPGHYHEDWNPRPMETGDSLDIGERQLQFVEAPMLHWPDSMFTYLPGQNILFPNDAFGQHYATGNRFNDEVNQQELWEEALKYFVNILTPFCGQIKRKIAELQELELEVEMIAPSHGVIWRDQPMQIVEKYTEWAEQQPEQRAVILYDTMWEATRKMADAIGEGINDVGVDCKVLPAASGDRNDMLVEIFKARTIVIGSSTLNNGVLPSIRPLLEDLRGLDFQNKQGAAFGSYGWSGEAIDVIEDHFEECDIPLAESGLKCKWQPDAEKLEECQNFGKKLGEQTKQK